MKKILLLSVVAMLGVSTFAQTSFADLQMTWFDGTLVAKTAIPASFSPASNANIYVPSPNFKNISQQPTNPGPWFDLSSYSAVQLSFTCATADLNKHFVLRVVVPLADNSGVTQLTPDVIFTTETQVVTIDLSQAPFASNGKRIWAFKVSNSGTAWGDAFGTAVNVNYINALSALPTSVSEMSIENNKLVDVYNITGVMVRKGVINSEATNGLPNGVYIVGNKKVYVRNK